MAFASPQFEPKTSEEAQLQEVRSLRNFAMNNAPGILTIPDWFIIITTIILIVLYIYFTWNFGYWKSLHVKTPTPYPVIGTFGNYLTKNVEAIDMEYYRKFGKSWGVYDGRAPGYFTTHPNDIKAVTVKDFQYFVDGRNYPIAEKSKIIKLFISFMEGEQWKASRKAVTPTFTSGKLRQMIDLMDSCAQDMVKATESDIKTQPDDLDVKRLIGMFTMDVIATCCFGYKIKPRNTSDPFVENAKLLFNQDFSFTLLTAAILPKLIEVFQISIIPDKPLDYFANVVKEIVKVRRQENSKRNDFLQLLLDIQEQERKAFITDAEDGKKPGHAVMTEEAIVAHSVLFLLVGFDTTATSICMAIYLMALNPECQNKLLEEIESTTKQHGNLRPETVLGMQYLDKVLSETLRLYPIIFRLERRCNTDYKLGHIPIKKGMMVSFPIYCIHHDEKYYPDPEKFDPERFSPENNASRNPYTYLPFGSGPRNCIGMRFALMEAKIGLAHFIKNFKVSPSSKTEIPVKFRKMLPMFVPLNGIHVKVEKRS